MGLTFKDILTWEYPPSLSVYSKGHYKTKLGSLMLGGTQVCNVCTCMTIKIWKRFVFLDEQDSQESRFGSKKVPVFKERGYLSLFHLTILILLKSNFQHVQIKSFLGGKIWLSPLGAFFPPSVLTLTWYTYMCLSFGLFFREIGYSRRWFFHQR